MTHTTFKDSDIGQIPCDWTITSVSSITSVTAGGTPSTARPEFWKEKIPWMRSGDIHKKIVRSVDASISELGLNSSSATLLPPNCVLIALAGQGKTRGTVAINEIELSTNQSIAAIYPTNNLVSKYLYYYLDSKYDELRGMSQGDGGRGGLNLTIIGKIKFPYPDISEQHAIATALSDMDALIEAKTALLEKKRAIKQGALQELLTGRRRLPGFAVTPMKNTELGDIPEDWEVRELGSLVDICSAKRVLQSQWKSDGIPFYRTREIIVLAEQGSVENELYISQELYKRNSCICPAPTEGDIMLTAVGTIGKTYLVREGDCFYYKDASVLCLRNQRKIVPGYLNLQLSYVTVQNQINGDSDGTTVKTITINKAKKYLIPVPSSTLEQERIHEVIQDQDNEIRSLQKELSKLSCIKQGMMQNLLTGRIRLV